MKKKNTSSVGQSVAGSSVSGSRSSVSSAVGLLSGLCFRSSASSVSVAGPSSPPCPPSLGSWARSLRMAGSFMRSLHRRHRSLSQNQILEFIRQRVPRQWQFVEVVGQWVWVHVSDSLLELERVLLFELGFHYSSRRRAFQHPCAQPRFEVTSLCAVLLQSPLSGPRRNARAFQAVDQLRGHGNVRLQ